jgi:aldose 1-epimerase
MPEAMKIFTIRNKNGLEVSILNYGGRIVSLKVPDRNNIFRDIVLGYDNPEDYLSSNEKYYGALVGRYANRLANGEFSINGHKYNLTQNEGSNTLHGGIHGFHNVMWNMSLIDSNHIELSHFSPHMEEGFPGNMEVKVKYLINNDNELSINFYAETDQPTIASFTHHSFFNLTGNFSRSITSHILEIAADYFTPVNDSLIPTGEIRSVKHTPFNFKTPTKIAENLKVVDEQLVRGKGFDHNWVITDKNPANGLNFAARIYEPDAGRLMEVFTNEPGIQFYSGNFLNGSDVGKSQIAHNHRTAFCLETQKYPDSPNHKNFPSAVLLPGQVYNSVCIYKFGVM